MSAPQAFVTKALELSIVRGQCWSQPIGWIQKVNSVETPVDISQMHLLCQFRRYEIKASGQTGLEAEPVLTIGTQTTGIEKTDPVNGLFRLFLPLESTYLFCLDDTDEIVRFDVFALIDGCYKPFIFGTVKAYAWATEPPLPVIPEPEAIP